jgi:outer membrane protein assembly factor BamB
MHENGPGSTAVLHGDRLIAHFDGSDQQFIAAFDKNTGKLAWKTPRSGEMDPASTAAQSLRHPAHRHHQRSATSRQLRRQQHLRLRSADRQELWKIHYGELGFSMSTVPVADDQQIYFSTAFGKSAVIALKHGGVKTPEVAWRNNKNAPKMCSPVLHDGLLFYVDDGGIVSCVDTKTGEALLPRTHRRQIQRLADSRRWQTLLLQPRRRCHDHPAARNSKSSPRTPSTAPDHGQPHRRRQRPVHPHGQGAVQDREVIVNQL